MRRLYGCCAAAAVLLAVAAAAFGGAAPAKQDAAPAELPPETIPAVEAASEEAIPQEAAPEETDPAGAVPEEAVPPDAQQAPPEQPEVLLTLLEQAGLELEDLETAQLIVVAAEGTGASLYGFEADGGTWSQVLGPEPGHVGKNGVTREKTEGDMKTPAGLFPIPFAFGIQPDPGCTLTYRQVTENSCWVDDPDSSLYNQWAEETAERDWNSAEHLSDYKESYAYALVVGYNMDPVVPGAGSAIFFHCGSRTTAGCISASEETVLQFMKWLTPDAQPKILIL